MKDSGKGAVVSHLDKGLDDYIKAVKKTSGGRMPAGARGRGNAARGGKTRGSERGRGDRSILRPTRVSRISRGGIRKDDRRGGRMERGRGGLRRGDDRPLRREFLSRGGPRRTLRLRERRAIGDGRRILVKRGGGAPRGKLALRPTGKPRVIETKRPNNQKKDQVKQQKPKKVDEGADKRLFVSDLPMNVTNNDLYTLFGQFGPLSQCRIDYDNLGKSYGTAILEYKKRENAQQALTEYNGAELDGKPIKIEFSKDRKKSINLEKKSVKKEIQVRKRSEMEPERRNTRERGNIRGMRRDDVERDLGVRRRKIFKRGRDERRDFEEKDGNRFERRYSRDDFRDRGDRGRGGRGRNDRGRGGRGRGGRGQRGDRGMERRYR